MMNRNYYTIDVLPITGIGKLLTYKVSVDTDVSSGYLVSIPIMNRKCLGIVVNSHTVSDLPENKIKSIDGLIYHEPIVTEDWLKLCRWVHQYYATSITATIEAMLPAVIRRGMQHKKNRYVKLLGVLEEKAYNHLRKKAPKQAIVYDYLKKHTEYMAVSELKKNTECSEATIHGLVEKKIINQEYFLEDRIAYKDFLGEQENTVFDHSIILNEEQAAAVLSIQESIVSGTFKVHLLQGVTGSGKTEVYLSAIKNVLERGGNVLFMVPEVILTPQTVGRIRSRLEKEGIKIVVWHSHLSDGERLDAWLALRRGEARVVVGARSAVFLPIIDLKLIVIDEEHESTYKQDESPRYHGKDVAIYRAMLNNAVCVLGSATPSLESFYNTQKKGYIINFLRRRIDNKAMPRIHIVDMKKEVLREEFKNTVVSSLLAQKLMDRFQKKEQSILFINKRGYSSSMLCPECGYIEICLYCSVAMTYHRFDESIKCHLCGFMHEAMHRCKQCGSDKIRWRGFGTQKVEEIIKNIIPQASIIRMDADVFAKKNVFRSILSDFRKGLIDVLIGTQMIAKGLDFPNVTLVGVIDADIGMQVQDFRANERTFQLLVQVAGRAGRGDASGEVVIQTFSPHTDAIQFARRSDVDGFLALELEQRREYGYPPHRHLIRHIFRGRNAEKVVFFIEKWKQLLVTNMGDCLEIRGPSSAPIEKIKDEYRYQIWYFVGNVSKWIPKIVDLRSRFEMDPTVIDLIDVDPTDVL